MTIGEHSDHLSGSHTCYLYSCK